MRFRRSAKVGMDTLGHILVVVYTYRGEDVRLISARSATKRERMQDENKAKYRAAKQHFEILNEQQDKLKYYFNFLTPEDYDYFFDHMRKGNYNFNSKLNAELAKNGL